MADRRGLYADLAAPTESSLRSDSTLRHQLILKDCDAVTKSFERLDSTYCRYRREEYRAANEWKKVRRADTRLDANPSFIGPKYLPQDKAEELSKALDAYMKEGFRLYKRQYKYDYFENRHVEDEIVNIINRRYNSPQASFINLNTLGEFDARPTLLEMKVPIVVMHGKKEQVIHPDQLTW